MLIELGHYTINLRQTRWDRVGSNYNYIVTESGRNPKMGTASIHQGIITIRQIDEITDPQLLANVIDSIANEIDPNAIGVKLYPVHSVVSDIPFVNQGDYLYTQLRYVQHVDNYTLVIRFRKTMADVWFGQNGTPLVTIDLSYEPEGLYIGHFAVLARINGGQQQPGIGRLALCLSIPVVAKHYKLDEDELVYLLAEGGKIPGASQSMNRQELEQLYRSTGSSPTNMTMTGLRMFADAYLSLPRLIRYYQDTYGFQVDYNHLTYAGMSTTLGNLLQHCRSEAV
jgi:hypothetical protein